MPSMDKELLWEKISNRLLKSMNERFDLLDNKFDTLLVTQREQSEQRHSEQGRRIQTLEQRLDEMEMANIKLLDKVVDLEGRGRRNNIKIVGIDEDEEKGRPTDFVTGLIPQIFG